MGIVGERPESGFRVDVERPPGDAPPWRYAGWVVTPSARVGIEIEIEVDGSVKVHVQGAAPELKDTDLKEKVRLLVRSAVKHAEGEGAGPPRRIVRWRAER